MARVNPPAITPAPTPAPQRADRPTFSDRVDAFVLWLTGAVAQFNGAATATKTNADDAFASAESAALSANAATSASNAVAWVSGANYAAGTVVYSPIDKRSYRRKVAGASTTDPSADAVNWVLLSHTPYALVLLATFSPASAAQIDVLNVFSAEYDNYVVQIEGLKSNVNADIFTRCITLGAPDSTTSYYEVANDGFPNTSPTVAVQIGSIGGQGPGITGEMSFMNVNTSTSAKVVDSRMVVSTDSAGATWRAALKIFAYVGSAPVTGFRLYTSAGQFLAGGRIRVYGYVNNN